MIMIAGTLEVMMMANMAQLQADMNTAKNAVGSAVESIERAVGNAATAFVAFAGIGTLSSFAGVIQGSIDATAALHDMAIQTGASEAALGEFRRMGAYTETSADSIAAAMNKLSKNMFATSEDGKGAGVAIKALGLDFDTFMKLSPEERMIAVGTAMNKFADGADKGAAAQLLFGKEGAKMLPFLKDLGDSADELSAKLTDQEKALKKVQAGMADAFGDNLIQIRKDADLWKKDLATGMTPALLEASEAYIEISKETGSFRDKIAQLSKDGSITEWTRTAITGMTYLMDGIGGAVTAFQTLGEFVGASVAASINFFTGLGTAVSQFATGDFSGAMTTMRGTMESQKTIATELTGKLDDLWSEETLGKKLRDRMEDLRGLGNASEEAKPKLDVAAILAANEAKRLAGIAAQKAHEAALKAEEEATKALAQEQAALAAETEKLAQKGRDFANTVEAETLKMIAQQDATEKLTPSQKKLLDLNYELAASLLTMSPIVEANTRAWLAQRIEIEQFNIAQKELQTESERSATKLFNATSTLEEATRQQKLHNEEIGLTSTELGALKLARMEEHARALIAQADAMEEAGQYGAVATNLRDEATAVRALAGQISLGADKTKWMADISSIGDGLASALLGAWTSGKSGWDAFKNYIIQSILDNVIKNALSSVIQAGLTSLSTGLSGSLGTFASAVNTITGGGLTAVSEAVTSGLGSISSALGLGSGAASAGGAGSSAVAGGGAGAGGAAGAGMGTLAAGAAIIAAWVVGGSAIARSLMGFGDYETWAASGPTASIAQGGTTYAYQPMAGSEGGTSYMVAVPGLGMLQMGSLADIAGSVAEYNANIANLTDWAELGNGGPGAGGGAGGGTGGYADGGDFAGGIRLVGERGPELELTGPSRIFDANTTAAMLRAANDGGNGASTQALQDEIRALREDNRRQALALAQLNARMVRVLERWDGDGLPVRNNEGDLVAVGTSTDLVALYGT